MTDSPETKKECMICGESLDQGYVEHLTCDHAFHYECLCKSYMTSRKWKGRHCKNRCPYCSATSGYLSHVNGLKKLVKGIHYNPEDTEAPSYVSVKCGHILSRGKNKGTPCNRTCQVGFYACKLHNKPISTPSATAQ